MRKKRASVVFRRLCSILIACGGISLAAGAPLEEGGAGIWVNLDAGPFAVGYRVVSVYDYSRSFKPATDFRGNPTRGAHSRPMQISIWYPATMAENAESMTMREYLEYLGSEVNFSLRTESGKQRTVQEWRDYNESLGLPSEVVASVINRRMFAVEDAQPLERKFPLLLYAPSIDSSPYENAVLIEYLVSCGFIVASSPSIGTTSRTMTYDWEGVLAQVRDVEFVMAYMFEDAQVDVDRIGAFGFSWGGLAVSILAVQNYTLDAILCMDGGVAYGFRNNLWPDFPYYHPRKVRAPYMFMANSTFKKTGDWEFLDGVKYAPSYLLHFKGLAHANFASLANLNRLYLLSHLYENSQNETASAREYRERSGALIKTPNTIAEIKKDRVVAGYGAVCRYVRNFFDAYLKKEKSAHTFLEKSPAQNDISKKIVSIERRSALPPPPGQQEFFEIIQTRGITRAVLLFKEYRARDPQLYIFTETSMNQLGYTYLNAGYLDEARELFKLNILAYPRSWNVYDSFAEASAAKGDIRAAIEHYKKSLELNPKNDNAKRMLQQLKDR